MRTQRDSVCGGGCTMQCAEDVLLSYTIETCIVL